jgi:integrase
MALLSLHCGLRAGEIFNLTWGDVDLERGILTLRDSKSGKTRMAFMTENVKGVIEKPDDAKHDDLVFPDRDDNKMKRISNAFQRAVNELGFNNGISDPRQQVVFHTLRHTFASWLVENGTDLYTVKELMGHSTLAMTERYSHLGQNTLQNAVRNLEKSLTTELLVDLENENI